MISATLLYTLQSLGGGKEIINIFHNLAKKEKKTFSEIGFPGTGKGEKSLFFKIYKEQVGSLSECILP
jgi:hypothetical protein